MKIHLACGKHILEGWTNCDIQRHPSAPRDPDILCDVKQIPLDDQVADELMAIHIFEHFYLWEIPDLLAEWNRLLKPGGKIILEMPDVMKAAKNLLEGQNDQNAMWPLYGDHTLQDPFMCHRWGWTYATIKPVLKKAGFTNIKEFDPQWHGKRTKRDFRVEATKC